MNRSKRWRRGSRPSAAIRLLQRSRLAELVLLRPRPAPASGDLLKIGEEQWQLQECYNCHKLQGEGGKKRGPELDNIGNLLTVDDIKQKILDPKSWMAEGFEKEFEKGKMPDKYKDLMEETDVVALATWLVTFKNTSVNTPKPIKKK